MDWDDEIDVVCVGSGAMGVAAEMAARAIGLTTHVVGSAPTGSGDLAARLGIEDAETVEYLRSVTDDITPTGVSAGNELPIRFVDGPAAPARPGAGVATFLGAALRTWAATCMASPCAVLTTEVSDPRLTTTYRCSGQAVEAVVVGSVEFGPDTPPTFDDWLTSWAHDSGLVVDGAVALQRLVFDDGRVVGAVLDGPTGTTAVRTRYGVVLPLSQNSVPCRWPAEGLDGVREADVALVTRAASRFGRLELFVPNPRQ